MDPATPVSKQSLSTYTPPGDSSPYIRTYAKDVAALTNTPIPPSQPAPMQMEGEITTNDGVTLAGYDSSPVNHATDPASPKEFEQEVVSLSAADSDGIFNGPSVPPAIVPTITASTAVPKIIVAPAAPSAPTPPPASTPAPEVTEDRDVVLARLRAKLASHSSEAAPFIPQAVPMPMREAAPTFETPNTFAVPVQPDPVQPPSLAPAPLPTPPPIIERPAGPSALHTYSTDFADRIDEQKSSTFSVLAAQSDAGQTPKSQPSKTANRLPLVVGAGMVIIGIGAVMGAYLYSRQSPSVPVVAGVPSLVSFDESVEVKGSGEVLKQSIASVANSGHVSGNVVVTYVTTTSASSTGSIPQPGGVLIQAMQLHAPDILLRNLDQSSTVGVISAGSETHPFMALKVTSYERTFAGMLAWEPTMAADLAAFYPPYASSPIQTASSTASTTAVLVPAVQPSTFTDAVVANHNVRILRDANGRSRIIYGYEDKDILIIARDEAAFSALAVRISSSGD